MGSGGYYWLIKLPIALCAANIRLLDPGLRRDDVLEKLEVKCRTSEDL